MSANLRHLQCALCRCCRPDLEWQSAHCRCTHRWRLGRRRVSCRSSCQSRCGRGSPSSCDPSPPSRGGLKHSGARRLAQETNEQEEDSWCSSRSSGVQQGVRSQISKTPPLGAVGRIARCPCHASSSVWPVFGHVILAHPHSFVSKRQALDTGWWDRAGGHRGGGAHVLRRPQNPTPECMSLWARRISKSSRKSLWRESEKRYVET